MNFENKLLSKEILFGNISESYQVITGFISWFMYIFLDKKGLLFFIQCIHILSQSFFVSQKKTQTLKFLHNGNVLNFINKIKYKLCICACVCKHLMLTKSFLTIFYLQTIQLNFKKSFSVKYFLAEIKFSVVC